MNESAHLSPALRPTRGPVLSCLLAGLMLPAAALAQSEAPEEETRERVLALRQEMAAVQSETQLKIEALQHETEQRLAAIQARLDQIDPAGSMLQQTTVGAAAISSKSLTVTGSSPDRLDVSGDFRLRYESNSSYAGDPSWDRGVMRGRVGASFALNDDYTMGARMVTGDPNNPRTSDFTTGDFAANFELSLDQAYLAYARHRLFLTGGKFAKPFTSTELVWDGDVNPQGMAGRYGLLDGERWSADLSGVYFVIDESIFNEGSDMYGGQLSLGFKPSANWKFGVHTALYDYDIDTIDPDVPGGFRGNNVAPDGVHYLSDFRLLDTVATASYSGFGERWNLLLIGDYVSNLGAEVPEDTGYALDVMLGSLDHRGDFLIRYGYAQVETDAVLGMFSNDNIVFPTNYALHTFSVDYQLQAHTFVGLTHYIYRRLDAVPEEEFTDMDWRSRTRLNLYVAF